MLLNVEYPNRVAWINIRDKFKLVKAEHRPKYLTAKSLNSGNYTS